MSDQRSALSGERFQELVEIMRTLRSEHGCAWDRQQTLQTLRPFVLQETYELLDALDRGDHEAVKHELGDFLFEAVFLAQICEEEGRFSIADSIQSIAEKLIRRHPHIFDEHGKASLTPKQVKQQWEEIKSKERKDAGESDKTLLSGVPRAMPSQLREAVATGGGTSREAEEEFGDLLFSLVNVARKLGIEPEAALRVANDKFQRRFDTVERTMTSEGHAFRDMTLDQLEAYWQRAKKGSDP